MNSSRNSAALAGAVAAAVPPAAAAYAGLKHVHAKHQEYSRSSTSGRQATAVVAVCQPAAVPV
jgi:hypothetical protein